MVATRNNRRCETCRSRRIKCDEKRPSCSQCIRAGWSCQYPKFTHQYIDEGPRVLKKQRLVHAGTTENGPVILTPSSPGTNATELLRLTFISHLHNSTMTATFGILPATPCLKHIPPLIGESVALDRAVACICAASSDLRRQPRQSGLSDTVRSSYVSTLQSLQAALNDPEVATKSETLAAVMLLHMFELRSNPRGDSFSHHAKGIVRLIEFRGPQKFNKDIDYAILMAEKGHIMLVALENREHCFIADKAWLKPLCNGDPQISSDSGSYLQAEPASLFIGAQLPGILKDFLIWQTQQRASCPNQGGGSIKHVDSCEPKPSERIVATEQLWTRVLSFRQDLLRWRARELRGIESKIHLSYEDPNHSRPSDPEPPSCKLPEAQRLGFECAAATFQILANHILCQLHLHMYQQSPRTDDTYGGFVLNDDHLVSQSVACAREVRDFYAQLNLRYKSAIIFVSRPLVLAWTMLAKHYFECSCLSTAPVLQGVGNLWPAT